MQTTQMQNKIKNISFAQSLYQYLIYGPSFVLSICNACSIFTSFLSQIKFYFPSLQLLPHSTLLPFFVMLAGKY